MLFSIFIEYKIFFSLIKYGLLFISRAFCTHIPRVVRVGVTLQKKNLRRTGEGARWGGVKHTV